MLLPTDARPPEIPPPSHDLTERYAASSPPNAASLRELIAADLDQHWIAWSAQHPHLAAAIDRIQLLDAAVVSLRDDAGFNEALRRARLDEYRLAQAARVLTLVRKHLTRLLPL